MRSLSAGPPAFAPLARRFFPVLVPSLWPVPRSIPPLSPVRGWWAARDWNPEPALMSGNRVPISRRSGRRARGISVVIRVICVGCCSRSPDRVGDDLRGPGARLLPTQPRGRPGATSGRPPDAPQGLAYLGETKEPGSPLLVRRVMPSATRHEEVIARQSHRQRRAKR
jgi:hypothetical protein